MAPNGINKNKHVLGKHNFEIGRGIIKLESTELETLAKKHVGELGIQGYKERVDFGKVIGEYALKKEGQSIQYLPTSKEIITHAKDGTIHIYPSNPKTFID